MSGAVPVLAQCRGCEAGALVPSPEALPKAWDAIFVPGEGWREYCPGCIATGLMESERAYRGIARREDWRLPHAIAALYRPAHREVLLAVPGGQATIPADDAARLHAALGAALAVRDHAAALLREGEA